jgi:hypothetical protein
MGKRTARSIVLCLSLLSSIAALPPVVSGETVDEVEAEMEATEAAVGEEEEDGPAVDVYTTMAMNYDYFYYPEEAEIALGEDNHPLAELLSSNLPPLLSEGADESDEKDTNEQEEQEEDDGDGFSFDDDWWIQKKLNPGIDGDIDSDSDGDGEGDDHGYRWSGPWKEVDVSGSGVHDAPGAQHTGVHDIITSDGRLRMKARDARYQEEKNKFNLAAISTTAAAGAVLLAAIAVITNMHRQARMLAAEQAAAVAAHTPHSYNAGFV